MSSSLRQPPTATTELASENDGIAPVGLAFRVLIQEQDMAFERQHPSYNSRAPVPLPSLYYHLTAVGHAELWEIAVLFFLLLHPPMTRLQYTCPCCARELTIPPFKNRPLRNLIYAWAQLRGHPMPPTVLRDDRGVPHNQPEAQWPFLLRYLHVASRI
ncbi:hypothetical protein ARMGADRAFT_1086349 [Armillaria gallica]|uniref:Uncharacterized protein n=1 Tax=Armillaria gallica TaxID=47427 RepID=A0A2H3D514_ARMGA|nr:hypothetical protein ARMGADRAFT_1086349 [Armillaria gallica]